MFHVLLIQTIVSLLVKSMNINWLAYSSSLVKNNKSPNKRGFIIHLRKGVYLFYEQIND